LKFAIPRYNKSEMPSPDQDPWDLQDYQDLILGNISIGKIKPSRIMKSGPVGRYIKV